MQPRISVVCCDIIKFVRHFFSSDGNKNIWDYISRQHSGGAGKTGLLAGVSVVVRVGLGEDVRCVSSLSLSLSLCILGCDSSQCEMGSRPRGVPTPPPADMITLFLIHSEL